MRSNLSKIYNDKDKMDILNTPSYHFYSNPIYTVNRFITNIDGDLNKNFIDNLKDLTIVHGRGYSCKSDYDYSTNTLFCGDARADSFGLLNVASNDRRKKYTGIITEDAIGYGLNCGLTDSFSTRLGNCFFSYPVEVLVSEILLAIDSSLVYQSYFNNNGELLLQMNNKIKELMFRVDNYHSNYLRLMDFYDKRFISKYRNVLNKRKNPRALFIESEIYKLEGNNFSNIGEILNILFEIIDNSNIKSEDKINLYLYINNQIKCLTNNEEFSYLEDVNRDFEDKCKKLTYGKMI